MKEPTLQIYFSSHLPGKTVVKNAFLDAILQSKHRRLERLFFFFTAMCTIKETLEGAFLFEKPVVRSLPYHTWECFNNRTARPKTAAVHKTLCWENPISPFSPPVVPCAFPIYILAIEGKCRFCWTILFS